MILVLSLQKLKLWYYYELVIRMRLDHHNFNKNLIYKLYIFNPNENIFHFAIVICSHSVVI